MLETVGIVLRGLWDYIGDNLTFNKGLLISLFLYILYLTKKVFYIYEKTGSYPTEFVMTVVTLVLGELIMSMILKRDERKLKANCDIEEE